jgi:O-acetyl-ADP-ribose deacetylase (regulator of RNase III)
MIKELYGDLIKMAKEGHFDLIAHGANCFCRMGSGIAKQIAAEIPSAVEVDKSTFPGDINKLGNYTMAIVPSDGFCRILNLYTQYNYGTDKIQIDYDALTLVLKKVNFIFRGKSIGLPLIGSGLAGGDWNKIKSIIEMELRDMDVTIVHYKP